MLKYVVSSEPVQKANLGRKQKLICFPEKHHFDVGLAIQRSPDKRKVTIIPFPSNSEQMY